MCLSERTSSRRGPDRGRQRALTLKVGVARRRHGLIDGGMTTAEYAIGTLAACGFAALLVTILRSGEVHGLLLGIIRRALAMG